MQHNLNDLNLELQRHKEILSQLSYVDGLTTIANRRRFNEYLEQEWKRGIRSGRPLALIILDIDHFKQFNDHYGHSSGDECLVKVARVLSSSVKRSCDLLARYGGEEFAVILPETQFSGARSVASAIKDDIQEAAIPHGYSPVASVLTVSIGLTARVPDGQYSSRYLIEAADRQLYAAKEAGRNQIQG
ncbi:MAG: GGDEF domain-containing protein [Desulfohalobiaceae bacterium]|nr:GGDEF domain-containing protein [Desulfohalobiaceae bacterium]